MNNVNGNRTAGDRGLRCRLCGCRHFATTHTEPLHDGRIRRRKRCANCEQKIVTYEGTISTLRETDRYM
jgi:transcriptional regulator NrdR family protein